MRCGTHKAGDAGVRHTGLQRVIQSKGRKPLSNSANSNFRKTTEVTSVVGGRANEKGLTGSRTGPLRK